MGASAALNLRKEIAQEELSGTSRKIAQKRDTKRKDRSEKQKTITQKNRERKMT